MCVAGLRVDGAYGRNPWWSGGVVDPKPVMGVRPEKSLSAKCVRSAWWPKGVA